MCIKDAMDTSSQRGRRIRSLQHVSFAYKSTGTDSVDTTQDPACNPANVVYVVGLVHGTKSILDTTMRSWIEDQRVIDQQWTPVSIQQGTSGNWRQHDIILVFLSKCDDSLLYCCLLYCVAASSPQRQRCRAYFYPMFSLFFPVCTAERRQNQ